MKNRACMLLMVAALVTPLPATPRAMAATAPVVFVLGADLPDRPVRPLLGVNAGPTPAGEPGNADLTAAYRAAGVTSVRTHDFYGPLDMSTMYPDQNADPSNPASYDFNTSDETFAAILGAGLEPYLRIGDSWNNVRRVTNHANHVRAAVEVVRRYRDPARWGSNRLRYVEFWNEPDGRFWIGSREEFFELFRDTALALQAEFPELKIGGPGLTPAGFKSPEGQSFTRGFLETMRASGIELGFFSWHMYSNDPNDFTGAAAFYRELLDSYGFPQAESHITEWNTEYREGGDPSLRTGARGAALMTAAWIGLQQEGVDGSWFYRGNDTSPRLPTFFGLFYADGRPKPIGQAFALWAEMAAHPTRIDIQGGSDSDGLWALAGRDATGEVALLVVNTSASTASWQLTGAPAGALALREVSDTSDGIATRTLDAPGADIGPYTVQLVTTGGPPALTVLSPNGGERLRRGKTYEIEWSIAQNAAIASQTIELLSSGGDTLVRTIASELAGETRAYRWSVSSELRRGKTYRVRVTARDASGNTISDTSDGNFRIK